MYGRKRDGRRNYVHFVTAYDIHFIVNNKYYAMKLQEKSETCLYIPRNVLHSEPLSRLLDLLSTGLSIYLLIILAVDILADLWHFSSSISPNVVVICLLSVIKLENAC